MEHFRHIQIHVFAQPAGFPDELKGDRSFALLKVTAEESVPPGEVVSFFQRLSDKLAYTPQL